MTGSSRLQFSLKAILLLLMMCAVAFSLVGVRGQLRKQWWEERVEATRREQRQVLAKLQHCESFPEWGERECEGHVVGLRLIAIPSVQDDELSDDLAHLKDLEWLERLTIEGTAVTVTARTQLDSFPRLNSWSFDQPMSVTRD
jgi:hypothetical protein